MFQTIADLLSSDSLSPHGICLLWRPELIGIHAVADGATGLAYFSIPVFLGLLVKRRPDIQNGWALWCFVAFILLCGMAHFMAVWTLWVPDYALEGLLKLAMATVSIVTAAVLWPLFPKLLALPSRQALHDKNEELLAMIAERDAALALLRQAQKMEALGQLAGGVAHDFNNVLTGVVLNLERLEKAVPKDDRRAQRALDNAYLATQLGAKIAGQMLAFSRTQATADRLAIPDQAIYEVAPLLADSTHSANIELDLALAAGKAGVDMDAQQFATALINLVVNARDAMPTGGRITISSWQAMIDGHPRYVVEVADNGVGMSPEVQRKALQPFFTTKPKGKGTGLGLAQVRGFAQAYGGDVQIDSRVGAGTRIRLTFPIKAASNTLRVADGISSTS